MVHGELQQQRRNERARSTVESPLSQRLATAHETSFSEKGKLIADKAHSLVGKSGV